MYRIRNSFGIRLTEAVSTFVAPSDSGAVFVENIVWFLFVFAFIDGIFQVQQFRTGFVVGNVPNIAKRHRAMVALKAKRAQWFFVGNS